VEILSVRLCVAGTLVRGRASETWYSWFGVGS